ncbi:glycosyltransferase [uncultured Deefgea sp.]|uniref:glycosyltransferase family protein n=1 Tax=uncultured Deefgea sp. TaxID=1304914 RepID=UPI0025919BCC|nr:glycosyltransferase [uncultured Deefgea sp.]
MKIKSIKYQQREKTVFTRNAKFLAKQLTVVPQDDIGSPIELESLSSELFQLQTQLAQRNVLFEQLKRDSLRNKLALNEANTQIEKLRQQVVQANQQVAKTKNTLSFQLGHALIFGTKSWSAFCGLPRKLWAIHQDAQRRSNKKTASSRHLPAASTPVRFIAADMPRLQLPVVFENFTKLQQLNGQQFAQHLLSLKVAAIMDEFTYGSYQAECSILQLTPADWQQELIHFEPELLLIESAWRGKDELWGNKVGHRSQELVGIVQWCRDHQVPTAFWNKEDPVHFETFLSTAKLFDFVFTTDIDCIHRYKAALGHDRVYFLPFAAQPRQSNPLEKYQRKDAFCFAGAYYTRYPERTRDLGDFAVNLPEYRPLEIYDRNFGKDNPDYQFPSEYQPFIVGNLPYAEIDKAYKGYRYAINLNSIKQSQSMFARRVYELLACNTITISNYSRGVRLMFGDLVLTSDNGAEIVQRLQALGQDDVAARKLRLAALRKIMSEHTYQDRLAYVVSKVSGKAAPSLLPKVLITSHGKDQSQVDALLAAFNRQGYVDKALILIVPNGFTPAGIPGGDAVRVFSAAEADTIKLADLAKGDAWLGVMIADDYYGENYLTDLMLATRYTDSKAIGKGAHYVGSATRGLELFAGEQAYHPVAAVAARSGVAQINTLGEIVLRDWVRTLYTAQFEPALAIDEFNYCKNGTALEAVDLVAVNDLAGLDLGLSLQQMHDRAEAIEPAENDSSTLPQINGVALAELFKSPAKSLVTLHEQGGCLVANSSLPDGKHEYIYANRTHTLAELGAQQGVVSLHLEATPGLNLQLTILFLDAKSQRIGHVVKTANRNHVIEIPAETAFVKLGLRCYASGSANVHSLLLGHKTPQPGTMFAQSQHLVLTNHYPSYDDLYRNGFVHSRVRAYRQQGVACDVFRLRAEQAASYHEFENIDVVTGGAEVLHKLLQEGQYQSVLVHFLDEAMWQVLQQYVDRIKVVVWVHGAEIQAYHRRAFMHETEAQHQAARQRSELRLNFWRSVLQPMPVNLKLVFVSRWLAETAMDDLGLRVPEAQYTIIHNPIDTEHFNYLPKPVEQRKKILSIRPYASNIYANDLSVKAILELAKEPFFNELEFRMIGDGPLFEETLAPLRQFNNVIIERRFLNRVEIAELHKQYGVFLCPTRMDTQGVSRDEAMASGLVPITNAVAAIPEFVDIGCGALAEPEDYVGLSGHIVKLFNDEKLFLKLSQLATQAISGSREAARVTEQELYAISGDVKKNNRSIIIKADDLRLDDSFDKFHRLVNLCSKYGAKVSIGIIGNAILSGSAEQKAIVKKWLDNDWVELWNHSWSHQDMTQLERDQQVEQITKTQAAIFDTWGLDCKVYGAPFNRINDSNREVLAECGIPVVYEDAFERNITPERNQDGPGQPDYVAYLERLKRKKNKIVIVQVHPGRWTDDGYDEFEKCLFYSRAEGFSFVSAEDSVVNIAK